MINTTKITCVHISRHMADGCTFCTAKILSSDQTFYFILSIEVEVLWEFNLMTSILILYFSWQSKDIFQKSQFLKRLCLILWSWHVLGYFWKMKLVEFFWETLFTLCWDLWRALFINSKRINRFSSICAQLFYT